MKILQSRLVQTAVCSIFVMVLFSACTGFTLEVINHPAPAFMVNSDPFREGGCLDADQTCVELAEMGCDTVTTAGDYLGGLEPAEPLVVCWQFDNQSDPEEGIYLYREGCLFPEYVRYVIERDGQFVLIESLADLRDVYAAVSSQDEALSYALAATGISAYYGLEAPKGMRYFVNELEDSHVVETAGGYSVHLYDYALCGCGPHTTYQVEVMVTSGGDIEIVNREPAFEDPEDDDWCVE